MVKKVTVIQKSNFEILILTGHTTLTIILHIKYSDFLNKDLILLFVISNSEIISYVYVYNIITLEDKLLKI